MLCNHEDKFWHWENEAVCRECAEKLFKEKVMKHYHEQLNIQRRKLNEENTTSSKAQSFTRRERKE